MTFDFSNSYLLDSMPQRHAMANSAEYYSATFRIGDLDIDSGHLYYPSNQCEGSPQLGAHQIPEYEWQGENLSTHEGHFEGGSLDSPQSHFPQVSGYDCQSTQKSIAQNQTPDQTRTQCLTTVGGYSWDGSLDTSSPSLEGTKETSLDDNVHSRDNFMTFLGSNWERNLQIQGSPSSETFSDVSSGASSMPSEIAITDETSGIFHFGSNVADALVTQNIPTTTDAQLGADIPWESTLPFQTLSISTADTLEEQNTMPVMHRSPQFFIPENFQFTYPQMREYEQPLRRSHTLPNQWPLIAAPQEPYAAPVGRTHSLNSVFDFPRARLSTPHQSAWQNIPHSASMPYSVETRSDQHSYHDYNTHSHAPAYSTGLVNGSSHFQTSYPANGESSMYPQAPNIFPADLHLQLDVNHGLPEPALHHGKRPHSSDLSAPTNPRSKQPQSKAFVKSQPPKRPGSPDTRVARYSEMYVAKCTIKGCTNDVIPTRGAFGAHVSEGHKEHIGDFYCGECNTTICRKSMAQHWMTHLIGGVQCTGCNRQLSRIDAWKRHIQSARGLPCVMRDANADFVILDSGDAQKTVPVVRASVDEVSETRPEKRRRIGA